MHPNAKNLTGQRFGRLTVLSPTLKRIRGYVLWQCRCDCSSFPVFAKSLDLIRGSVKSCGCLRREKGSAHFKAIGSRRGDKASNWRGGIRKHGQGYLRIYKPEHPHADVDGYVFEHRLVMEKKLGRYLQPDEVVHHIDENPANNDLSNLKLFSNNEEHLHHHRAIQNASTV